MDRRAHRRGFFYAVLAVPLLAVLLVAPSATSKSCRAGCKAAKKMCAHAATAAFVTAKATCDAETGSAGRRSCKQTARAARTTAKASCKSAQTSCIAACGGQGPTTTTLGTSSTTSTSESTSTTTTLPGPTCGDAETAGLAGVTHAHDAVRADPSLDSDGVTQPTPNPALSPLCYSATVAATAQGWADQCMFMHNANRGNLGENIYAVTGEPAVTTAADAVTAWSSEAAYYNYASNTCAAPISPGTCGHYTQVVWRDTNTLGCGIQVCAMNSPFAGFSTWTFVVCDYQPSGNVSMCDAQGMNCVLELPY